ncbi:hypothetical protein M427DRAFT_53296, partial [Gonapodya prolifera JEL478]
MPSVADQDPVLLAYEQCCAQGVPALWRWTPETFAPPVHVQQPLSFPSPGGAPFSTVDPSNPSGTTPPSYSPHTHASFPTNASASAVAPHFVPSPRRRDFWTFRLHPTDTSPQNALAHVLARAPSIARCTLVDAGGFLSEAAYDPPAPLGTLPQPAAMQPHQVLPILLEALKDLIGRKMCELAPRGWVRVGERFVGLIQDSSRPPRTHRPTPTFRLSLSLIPSSPFPHGIVPSPPTPPGGPSSAPTSNATPGASNPGTPGTPGPITPGGAPAGGATAPGGQLVVRVVTERGGMRRLTDEDGEGAEVILAPFGLSGRLLAPVSNFPAPVVSPSSDTAWPRLLGTPLSLLFTAPQTPQPSEDQTDTGKPQPRLARRPKYSWDRIAQRSGTRGRRSPPSSLAGIGHGVRTPTDGGPDDGTVLVVLDASRRTISTDSFPQGMTPFSAPGTPGASQSFQMVLGKRKRDAETMSTPGVGGAYSVQPAQVQVQQDVVVRMPRSCVFVPLRPGEGASHLDGSGTSAPTHTHTSTNPAETPNPPRYLRR